MANQIENRTSALPISLDGFSKEVTGVHRNLSRLYQPFHIISKELKERSLALLPEHLLKQIYAYHELIQHSPLEEKSEQFHLLDSESELQQAVYQVGLKIFKGLEEDKRNQVLFKMAYQKMINGESPRFVLNEDVLRPEETGLFLNALGDLENEPIDLFCKLQFFLSQNSSDRLRIFSNFQSAMNQIQGMASRSAAINLGSTLFKYYEKEKNIWIIQARQPLIFPLYHCFQVYLDILCSDPCYIKQLITHLSYSEVWQQTGVCFKEVHDIFSKTGFKMQKTELNLFNRKIEVEGQKNFFRFILSMALFSGFKLGSDECDFSLLLDLVKLLRFQIFAEPELPYRTYQAQMGKKGAPFHFDAIEKQDIESMTDSLRYLQDLLETPRGGKLLLQSVLDLVSDQADFFAPEIGTYYESELKYFRFLAAIPAFLGETFLGGVHFATSSCCSSENSQLFLTYLQRKSENWFSQKLDQPSDFRCIEIVLKRLFSRLKNMDNGLENRLAGLFSVSKFEYYLNLFFHDVQKCYNTISDPRASYYDVSSAYHKLFNMGKLNERSYRDYIYRLEDASATIHTLVDQARKDLLVLEHMPSFLQEGKIQRLFERLSAETNIEIQDAILFDEILLFTQEPKSSSKIETPSESLLNNQLKQRFAALNFKWVGVSEVLENLINVMVYDSSRYTRCLFLGADYYLPYIRSEVESITGVLPSSKSKADSQQPFFNSSRKDRSSSKSKSKKKEKDEPDKKTRGSKEPAISDLQSSANRTSSSSSSSLKENEPQFAALTDTTQISSCSFSKPISSSDQEIDQRLNRVQNLFQSYFDNFKPYQSHYAKISLKDAQEHFILLTCAMRHIQSRFHQNAMSNQALFAFVNDCIRHTTLGVEQLLLALYQETCGVKSSDKPFPNQAPTHDLLEILEACELQKGDLISDTRKWLKEINRGEVILRHRNMSRTENKTLNRLLEERDQLLTKDNYDPALLVSLKHFMMPLAEFLDSVQPLFPLKTTHPTSLGSELSNLIADFFLQLQSKSLGVPGESSHNPLLDSVYEIRRALRHLLTSDSSARFFGELDDTLNSLLVHLEEEIQVQAQLEPIQAQLHLSNVVLLNQQIIESILSHVLYSKGVVISFEEKSQHDLKMLMEKLEFDLSDFTDEEMELMSFCKASRQLARYPAFYAAQNPNGPKKSKWTRIDQLKSLLMAAKKLSLVQRADEDLKGFTLANKGNARDLDNIKAFTQREIELMTSIVKKVLGPQLSRAC